MLAQSDLETLFFNARSQNGWLDKEVSHQTLIKLYDLLKYAPTAANCNPARFVFVKSKSAKQRLKPCLNEGNVEKSLTAPVVAIIAYDLEFYQKLPKLFPHTDAKSWYENDPKTAKHTSYMNATLQGAYLIMAARALGLDCGPMSGFNKQQLDQEFFSDGQFKSIFICGLGHGDSTKLFPRSPRLDFTEACTII